MTNDQTFIITDATHGTFLNMETNHKHQWYVHGNSDVATSAPAIIKSANQLPVDIVACWINIKEIKKRINRIIGGVDIELTDRL